MSRPLAHIGSLEPRADSPRNRAHDDASLDPLPAGTVLRHYRLGGVAHTDDLGLVYRATDLEGGADVAIKEFFPAAHAVRAGALEVVPRDLASGAASALALQRRVFDEQGRLLVELRPGSTPSVLAEWQERGTAYRAMPWIEGTTLAAFFATLNGPAGEWVLRSILGPLLGALHGLHRHGVQHGRLTPERVLLTKDVRVLLLGLRALPSRPDNSAVQARLSADEAYSAPEWLGLTGSEQGPLRVGPWSDIYSVGAILHRAITGMPPALTSLRLVQGQTPSLARIAAGDYDDGFLRAIDSALSMQPDERPRNVDQFCARLGLGECRVPANGTTMVSQAREAAPGELRFRELPDGPAALVPDRGQARAPVNRPTAEIPSLASDFADTELLDPDAATPTAAPAVVSGASIWLPLPLPEVLVPKVPVPEVLVAEVSVPEVTMPKVPVPEVRRVVIARPPGRGDPTQPYRVVPVPALHGLAVGEGAAGALDTGAAHQPAAHGGSLISIMTPSMPVAAPETGVVRPIQPTLPISLDHGQSGHRFLSRVAYAVLTLAVVLTVLWTLHLWSQTRPRSPVAGAARAAPMVAGDRAEAASQAVVKAKPMTVSATMKAEPTRSAPVETLAPSASAGAVPHALLPVAQSMALAMAPATATAPPAASPTGRSGAVRNAVAPRPPPHDARCADRLLRLSLDDTKPSATKKKPQGACP